MKRKVLIVVIVAGVSGLLMAAELPSMDGSGGWYAAEGGAARGELYRSGQKALDEGRWGDAATIFQEVAEERQGDEDAALYWFAYARLKQGLVRQSLNALKKLQRSYPESPWIDDARALEVEARQQAGNADVATELEDEELKLYAVNSLMHMDSERAVPIVEDLLSGESSAEVKERALFVLTQTDSPRAREILVEVATAGEPPQLRHRALEFLGLCDHAGPELEKIYASSDDPHMRAQVLESLMIADDEALIVKVARTESDPELRSKAIELLGVMDASSELREIYAEESDPRLKAKILEGMFVAEDVDALLSAARTESDPRLRGKAIEGLGVVETEKSREAIRELYGSEADSTIKKRLLEAMYIGEDTEALSHVARTEADPAMRAKAIEGLGIVDTQRSREAIEELYGQETDPRLREKLLEAMFIGEDHEALIEVIRTEDDPGLRRKALEYLSMVDSEEAAEYLLELIEK